MSQMVQRESERVNELAEPPIEHGGFARGAEFQRSLIAILWHRRWIVMSVAALGMLLGFIYVLTATPIYTSTSRVYAQWEPGELRGSRRVLRERRGEVPLRYSPCHYVLQPGRSGECVEPSADADDGERTPDQT